MIKNQDCIAMKVEEERTGFKIHRMVYVCIIGLLILVNMMFTPDFIWFIFPLIGWGMGLAIHFMNIRNLPKNK